MVKVKLADIPVCFENRYPDLEYLCRGYETDDPPQITLSVTQEEIDQEREGQLYEFTDGYLETVCLYRKLALEMLKHKVFIMHASVVDVDGAGYAFLAHSGVGKSTQTRLWLEHFGSRARVINGDKPLIRVAPDGDGWKFVAYGTPWCGKEGLGCNASVPLKALFLLERAPVPSCEVASQECRIDRIFHQMLMPERPDQMMQLLDMADLLVEAVPFYVLHCNMKAESVTTAYHAVCGNTPSPRKAEES